jgi:ornithine cyclodeaminase/alanine dehydrogenase-like protein (mu-crystallin family)
MRILSNDDVRRVLGMRETMAALRVAYDELRTGEATYGPRIDYYLPTGRVGDYYQWGSMTGASRHFGVVAVRMKSDIASWPDGRTQEKYCLRPGLYCGLIMLFEAASGLPTALIQDGYLQHLRVGGAAGIGTSALARPGPQAVGMLGSGGMARTFLEAFALVRPLAGVRVYSPHRGHREAYAAEMSAALDVPVQAVASAEQAVRGAGIVASATDSMSPTFDPAWLAPGAHVVCVTRRELGSGLLARADRIIQLGVHTIPYGTPVPMMEWKAGGIAAYVAGRPAERAAIPASTDTQTGQYPTLADVETGRAAGRASPEEVTLFVATGTQGLQFAAVGGAAARLAAERGLGRHIPDDWLLEDIRD